MRVRNAVYPVVILLLIVSRLTAGDEGVLVGHGIAMHGDLKYGPDFEHFDYVNPTASKGGAVRLRLLARSTALTRLSSRETRPRASVGYTTPC